MKFHLFYCNVHGKVVFVNYSSVGQALMDYYGLRDNKENVFVELWEERPNGLHLVSTYI